MAVIEKMECFNNLLLKLREVHEREVDGWQIKIQELSNKKGCDTKRMEELFTKNQQMKEQQRLLTDNIKTLENRLRAGLCDRCTVTQEVAKRRQQEFEASTIQSIQHLTVLAGEMNNQKRENKGLRDELKSLRAALEARSDEGLDQRLSIPPQALLLRNSSSSTGREVNHSRHVLHAPVPCRPQPIMSCPATLPWHLSESYDWASAVDLGTSLVVQPPLKPNPLRFPNLIPTSQHATTRRQVSSSSLPKQSTSQPSANEPTTQVFRLRNMSEHVENHTKPREKKEIPTSKTERVSGELREACEGPLDLSERGKSKSSQTPRDDSPLALQDGERVQRNPDKDVKVNPSANGPVSSPSPVIPPSCSFTPPAEQDEESTSDQNHKHVLKEQEQKEEPHGMSDQSNEKKVPVLTISLRPVVVLETLNSALQESLSANGKSSYPAVQPGSSSDEQDEEKRVTRQESNQGCKRKRESVETETDRDSETDNPVSKTQPWNLAQQRQLTPSLRRHRRRRSNSTLQF
ncbi:DNA endonuclease RBBP8 [Cottoperca gobio]|uniref:DNA endonuclease RBBP8 n=1 Tax=Cottoperca gobio TaxID=56716 RepID=A0A6J2Q2I6_COTGO|nr:RBBP8 N-terminal-like protein [Cottoperca gobio]